MATLNAVIIKSKEGKNGRNKVRISVAHNGETRYIVTDITLDSSNEFRNGAVVKRPDAAMINTKIRGLLQRYQTAIDDLEYIDGLSCAELVFQLKNAENNKRRTLKSIYEEYIECSRAKQSSLATYKSSWNAITTYLPDKTIIDNISHQTVVGMDKKFRDHGLAPSTISAYMALFMSLVKYALRCGYVQFRADPFMGYHLPKGSPRQSWITVEEVKRIRDIDTTRKNIIRCRDMFMLSYYLGGINITDLLDINFNEQQKTLKYIRKKTDRLVKVNPYVEFDIPEEAKEIIAKYKAPDGKLKVINSKKEFLLKHIFTHNMPLLAEMVGVKGLIYYSARKSFSQHAFDLGINTGVIDYILGHKLDKVGNTLYNYVYVTPEMATEAIRKVLDNLK